ncbi:hypothetical protein [Ponticaulis sp.]|uniref:hypothetical protein n=1 Tax=Ponticaulis sp. TaxID=2020902 RepID=UPI0025F84614|nr:hypothetical protein [Ponticaulis sp.]
MRDPVVDFLARSFEAGCPHVSIAHWARIFGASYEDVMNSQLFTGRSDRKTLPCDFCDHPGHPVEVSYVADLGVYSGLCPSQGPVHFATLDVETQNLREDLFLQDVATAFECDVSRIRKLRESFWDLGSGRLGNTEFSVFVARQLHDFQQLKQVIQTNREGIGIERGIILTANAPEYLIENAGTHRFAVFADVLTFEEGRFLLRPDALRKLLNIDGKRNRSAPKTDLAKQIFLQHLSSGEELPKGEKSLRKLLSSNWPKDMELPGRSAIFKGREDALSAST